MPDPMLDDHDKGRGTFSVNSVESDQYFTDAGQLFPILFDRSSLKLWINNNR